MENSKKTSVETTLAEFCSPGVIPVIRAQRSDTLASVAEALMEGGLNAIEITMTTPGAIESIAECADKFKNSMLVGAGTVLDPGTAEKAIEAGASFIVSPSTDPDTIKLCKDMNTVVCPGALTPTEVYGAWTAGADIVKIFPARPGGPLYFRDLKGPFPEIRIMPTGGVDLVSAPEFIKAGACAVGVGGALVHRDLINSGDFAGITRNARAFAQAVTEARE